MPAESPVVLITGGNTGLGYEVVKALLRSSNSYIIILGCRSIQKGDEAISALKKDFPSTQSNLSTVSIDLESDSSIESAFSTLSTQHGYLDVLINNGGGNFDHAAQSGALTYREAWNKSWDVNVSGTMFLTHTLAPLLLKSSNPRLLFVTSGTSTLAETERLDTKSFQIINASPEAGWPKAPSPNPVMAYRSSKTGLNMAMREWHRMLKNDGVKVWAISPGFLATGLAGLGAEKLKQLGALDPSVGGEFIKDVVEGKRDEDVGKVIRSDMIQPW